VGYVLAETIFIKAERRAHTQPALKLPPFQSASQRHRTMENALMITGLVPSYLENTNV
jgi:hypothetical protein